MRKVIGIGETVLDIIFRNDQPISAIPGGSSFNAVISLGRSGVEATFIGETGNDRVGRNTIQFLRDNGVRQIALMSIPIQSHRYHWRSSTSAMMPNISSIRTIFAIVLTSLSQRFMLTI